jgi:hypothetical protein
LPPFDAGIRHHAQVQVGGVQCMLIVSSVLIDGLRVCTRLNL